MNWEKFKNTLDQHINLKTRFESPEDIEIDTQKFKNLTQLDAWNTSFQKNHSKILLHFPPSPVS